MKAYWNEAGKIQGVLIRDVETNYLKFLCLREGWWGLWTRTKQLFRAN